MTEEVKYRTVTDWNAFAYFTVGVFAIVLSISAALGLIISFLTGTHLITNMVGLFMGSFIGTILGYLIASLVVKRQGRSLFTKIVKVDSNE